jgi:glycerol-3-phosphate O-acyltransferase
MTETQLPSVPESPAPSTPPAGPGVGKDLAQSSPLLHFGEIRPAVLEEVAKRSMSELARGNLDLLLGEAVYSERLRIKREKFNVFTRARAKSDRALLGHLQSGVLKPAAMVDRRALLESLIRHYGDEIGGRFDPKVYRFATHAVPVVFDWLLNYASVRKLMPWKLKESVQSRLQILGETEHLRKLASKGTVLLVPTHQSNIDSILIGYIIYLMGLPPFAYGAGLNLFSNPVLSYFMGNLGAYTVDRKKNNAIYKAALKHYSTGFEKRFSPAPYAKGGRPIR